MTKHILLILSCFIVFGCHTTKEIRSNKYYWIQILDNESYLQIMPTEDAITEKVLSFGSIVYAYKTEGDYLTVYLKKSKHQEYVKKYYLYKPKFKTIEDKRYFNLKLNIKSFGPNNNYITGPRGGCYYVNDNERKIYVDRSYCSLPQKKEVSKQQIKSNYKSYKSTTKKSSSVQCSGRTKKGVRCRNRTKSFSGRCHLH